MKKLAALVTLGVSLVATSASADPTTITPITIHGRPAKPSVVIEIARARPGVAITTPTLATVMKIESAAKKDPL